MSLQAAILGFLDLEATTGYMLKQRFDGSVGAFWTATQSQIYRELHALEAAGMVAVEVVPQDGKPAKKVYALTEAGSARLAAWLDEPLEPLQLRHPLLLKLVFSAGVEPSRLDALLGDYAAGVERERAGYAEAAGDERIFGLARSPREGALWQLGLEHGVAWCDAELAWIAKARARLERTKSPATPPKKAKAKATPPTKRKKAHGSQG